MNRENYLNIISFLLALLFSYAALSKAIDLQKFQVQLGQSTMLGFMAMPLSYVVPTIELLLAVLIFMSRTRLVGFYISFSLMVTFTSYIIVIMNYSYHVPCSCGGILGALSWRQHLVFNLFFVLLILTAILILESDKQSTSNKMA